MTRRSLRCYLLAALILIPGIARADSSIIGTDAYALAADSIANVFYQGKLSNSSAFLVELATTSGATMVQGSYKAFFGGRYANAPYVAGGVLLVTSSSTSVTGLVGKIGYEFKVGRSLVLSPYYGIVTVSGYNFDGIGFNVGVRL
jgi:hypothetical protein